MGANSVSPRLTRLSLSHQLLVALARPDATFIAGFKAWLAGRAAAQRDPNAARAPCELLNGDSHTDLIAALVAFAESLGYRVSFESIAGAAARRAALRGGGTRGKNGKSRCI